MSKLFSLALGILNGLVFAPTFLTPALMTLSVVCYLTHSAKSAKEAFGYGLYFGFGSFLSSMYWIAIGVSLKNNLIWHDYTNINGFSFAQATNNSIFNYKEFLGFANPKFWSLLLLFILFATPGFDPTLFQRVSKGRFTSQVQKAFSISAILLLLILMGMSWIGFLLFNVDPKFTTQELSPLHNQ